ncbi:hypothetical protein SYNPS1DRAFT_30918 [Syncephalis pseudoplumigaleata]|uniref:SS18 N-terminal domain-containing protein n=1 Tax=Syncephalis pseudoplumigaleata TaxID=1712513 RepID=A0A4P9YU49_9FUNG|nr:hypothetical protein SYNPS1DRAFT_30918 [Syncephalis pseudoplumigaleata]|eukprot:RKP23344.1 hypothetical protein SYNPS1DRAFT_30918 [Syncephalis pseudoplumigaleata]
MYEAPNATADQPVNNHANENENEDDDDDEDEGEFDASMSPHDSAADESETNEGGGDPSKRAKKSSKRDADDAVTDEVDRPSFIPELSPRVIETVLQVNMELIRLCVEYQNRGWFQDPDYAIYQARLQSNLTYLASVADYHLKPDKPTALSERVNGILAAARKAQEEQIQVWKTEMERQSRNAFDRLHQAERERAINSSTASTPTQGGGQGGSVSGDLRKRKRVKEATKVTRVMDPQAGMGGFGSYQPVAPFVFGGAGMALPGRIPGAPMVMGASTSNHVPMSLPQQQQQQQQALQQASLSMAAQNTAMGSHGGMLSNPLANANQAIVHSQAAMNAATSMAPSVPPSSSSAATAETTVNSTPVASLGMAPQIAQLAAQLGLHPSAVAQLTASGAVSSADILQLTNAAMSGHAAAGTTTSAAALSKPVVGLAMEAGQSTAASAMAESGMHRDLPSTSDKTNVLASHIMQDAQQSGHNSANPSGLANLGSLEAIAAANGLDPAALSMLSPQALLSALGSSGGESLVANNNNNSNSSSSSNHGGDSSNTSAPTLPASTSAASHNGVGGGLS